MNYLFPKLSLALLVMYSCGGQEKIIEGGQKAVSSYDLLSEDDTIYVEKFDTNTIDQNKYNNDNYVFITKKGFKYSYSFTKNNTEYYASDFSKEWELLECNDSLKSEKEFVLEVVNGNPMTTYMPDYNQTNIFYKYPDGSNSITGVVENKRNIWQHPPRAGIFRLLEILPFPYTVFPIKIGDTYSWSLTIGDHYADSNLVYWEGTLENTMIYKVESIKVFETELGALECAKIEAQAESKIGISKASFLYNKEYGFVKMEFKAVDSSVLTIHLKEIYDIQNINDGMSKK